MSDVFDVAERARPEIDPIPPDDRRRFREELFHDGRRTSEATAEAAMVVPWQTRRRSRQLVVIVGLLLIGGLIALFVAQTRDDGETDTATATPPTSADADETTTNDSQLPVQFEPLLLDSPPGNYQLHWARYDGDDAGSAVGLARYVNNEGGPEISILLRSDADAYTGQVPDDARTWKVKGRRLIAAPESGLCDESVCSVNVQWSDDTAVTVSWVNWDGTSLNGGVTHDRLVKLVRGLTPKPRRWEPGSINAEDPTWDMPNPESAPLLLPGGETPILTAEHSAPWPGSSSVAVRAPDGSVLTLQEGDGSATEFDQTELVRQGSVAVVPPKGPKQRPLDYNLEVICGFSHVADQPGSGVLRPVLQRLLDSMTVDRGEITVELRNGWSKISAGDNAAVYAITFNARVGGDDVEITLLQSPGGTTASFLYGRGPFSELDFGGELAWREEDTANKVRVIGTRAGTPFEIRAKGVTLKELRKVFNGLRPTTLDGWNARFATSTTPAVDSSCPQQPFFIVRRAG